MQEVNNFLLALQREKSKRQNIHLDVLDPIDN
jgi:hypothetical protein